MSGPERRALRAYWQRLRSREDRERGRLHPWSAAEDETVRQHWRRGTPAARTGDLLGVSAALVRQRQRELGLRRDEHE